MERSMFERDKREWQRVAVDLPAQCCLVDGAVKDEIIRIVDVHQQGCCIQGRVYFEKGKRVRVMVEIPFEGPVSITGEVAWSGPVNGQDDLRTGMRFLIDTPLAQETCLKLYHHCLLRRPKG